MKAAKTIFQTAKNASKLHKHVGDLLVELFPGYEVRQEYSVNQVNKSFHSGREKFDWVVLGLKIVVEIHGEQHYEPICFGGMLMSKAKKIFEQRVVVDKQKQDAAEEAGFAYLVIKFDEKKITAEELSTRINEAMLKVETPEEIVSYKPKQKIQSRGFNKNGPKQKIPLRGFSKRKIYDN